MCAWSIPVFSGNVFNSRHGNGPVDILEDLPDEDFCSLSLHGLGTLNPTYLQTLQYPVHHSHEIVYKKWNGKYALFITPTLHGVRFRIYTLDLRGVWMAGVKPRTPMSTVNACRAFLGRYWNNHCMFGAI